MTGPVATIGDIHTCPMCSGTTPHVGGPIIGPGTGMTINGKPIAVIGDVCACTGSPDTIVQGSAGMTINRKAVVVQGCMTAHGGTVDQVAPGIVIKAKTPSKPITLSVSEIPFPKIKLINKVLGNTKEAQTNQQKLKKEAEAAEEKPREITLESTYPLVEAEKFAEQLGATFFNYGMQSIFGESKKGKNIPMHAYDYLYRDLSDKKVQMPAIAVDAKTHGYARYKKEDNTIYIAQQLVVKATEKKEEEAIGNIYLSLMEEFGHFLDWQLRSYYTTLGGDAALDEGAIWGYCLTTFNVFKDTEINFGKASVDGTSYNLSIDVSEIQQQVDKLVTEERIKQDKQDQEGEYFSAGMQDFNTAGGYTHFGIEKVLITNKILENDEELNYIYLGNLLRDWSQLITPNTERYTQTQQNDIAKALQLTASEKKEFFGLQSINSIKLSRKHLSFLIELIAAHEILGGDLDKTGIGAGKGDKIADTLTKPKKATDTVTSSKTSAVTNFVKDKAKELGIQAITRSLEYYTFVKRFPKLNPTIIGVYKPQEHIDNPIGAAVVDLITQEYLYWPTTIDPDINAHYGMKNYIRAIAKDGETEKNKITQTGIKHTAQQLPTATAYIAEQLSKSFKYYNRNKPKESLLYFGNALHTIEDFFAHSNFVELCLIKRGYNKVVPWVNYNDAKALAFTKTRRKVTAFSYRKEEEDYFGSNTLIDTFKSIEDLHKKYPEARRSKMASKNTISFIKNGESFEYYLEKGQSWDGQLHILNSVVYTKDIKRGGNYLDYLPIVTGRFGKLDMIYSLLDKMEDMFKPHKFGWKDFFSSKWEGKSYVRLFDLMMLTILTDLKYAQNTEYHKDKKYKGQQVDYVQLIKVYESVINFRGVVFSILEKTKKGKGIAAIGAYITIVVINALENFMMNVVKKVIEFAITGIALGIREAQNLQHIGTNPTHTQIAKDTMSHPLHKLAGELARIAVADIGRQFVNAKDGLVSEKEVITIAQEYLSHPQDVSWMDMHVRKWAIQNIGHINTATHKGKLEKLHHDTHTHMEEAAKLSRKAIKNINKQINELENFYKKTKDNVDDLEISRKAKKTLLQLEKYYDNLID